MESGTYLILGKANVVYELSRAPETMFILINIRNLRRKLLAKSAVEKFDLIGTVNAGQQVDFLKRTPI